MNVYLIVCIVASFGISVLTNKFLLLYLHRKGVMDIPNERSSHKIPTPRGGGIGIVLGVLISSFAYSLIEHNYKFFILVAVSFIIGMVGLVDDVRKGLHTGLRFGIQFACAAIIIWVFDPIDILPLPSPLHVHLHFFGIIISFIWLIGIANIFNFLDGIDGYAGTQGFIGGIMLALVCWGTPVAFAGIIIAAASAGFLLYNWHPAKIFMGDVGSSFLGFLFAALPFYFKDKPGYDIRSQVFFAMAIILWFFLLDGTFTIFRRLFKREKIWQAHRSHLYQRLVISGMSHSEVVLTVCFFYMLLLAPLAYMAIGQHKNLIQWPILIAGIALFIVYIIYTMIRERKKRKLQGENIS